MSRFTVEKGLFDGQETYVLTDTSTGLQGTLLPGFGSNLIDLRYTDSNAAILRKPRSVDDLKTKAVGWGFPVLMPPNRIAGGKFSYNGRDYVFDLNEKGINHIHGLVNDIPWKVVETDTEHSASVTAAVRSDDFPSIKKVFPQSFELRMTFSLKGHRIGFLVEAENFDEDPMPFGIGFHPYFNVPLAANSTKSQCFVSVPANSRWELTDCIPTGRRLPAEGAVDLRTPVSLGGTKLDDVYTDLTLENGASVAEYTDKGAGITVKYGADDQFKHWVVFTGHNPEDPFVCLEPYTWVTNAPNLDLPKDETGLIDLEKGKGFVGEMWLEIVR